jgi:hypothetical protein
MATRFPSSAHSPMIFSEFGPSSRAPAPVGPLKPSAAPAPANRRALGDITNAHSKTAGLQKNQPAPNSTAPGTLKLKFGGPAPPVKQSAPVKTAVQPAASFPLPSGPEIEIEKAIGHQGAYIEPFLAPEDERIMSDFTSSQKSIFRSAFDFPQSSLKAELADEATAKEISDAQLAEMDFNIDDF